jgi:AcrR family transcriptional regulator
VTPAARARARRGEGDRLRSEIIEAAARLMAERGSEEAVSIRAIADAVGVTPPSIYLHFADKDELIVAVCDDRFAAIESLMTSVAADATSPLDEVCRRGAAYIRFGLDNPEHYRILMMTTGRPTDPAKVSEWAALQHMIDAVERCMDAGQIRRADPLIVTLGLWAAVHGLTSLIISKPDFPWPPLEDLIHHVLTSNIYGLV